MNSVKETLKTHLWINRRWVDRILILIMSVVFVFTSVSYGVTYRYQQQIKDEPLVIGATFISNYAEYFELDARETLQAMIDDLGIKRFRLVSYWNKHEPQPDQYDFSDLDWQFDMIEEAGGEVALAIGLRQPRWPECHGPQWAMDKSVPEWTEDLKEYMGVTIDRYKDRDVLVEYQLENEFFLSVFGECPDFTRERLVDEYNFVKTKDDTRPLIVNRSNNALGIPIGEPRANKNGVATYKRVWDKTVTKRYYEYPLPAWFYGALGAWGNVFTGNDLFIHELQTESWLAESDEYDMRDAPIDELYKTMNPDRLKTRLRYGVDTGLRTIDVWGVEWWYQMKVKRDAPELWNTAREEIRNYNNQIY